MHFIAPFPVLVALGVLAALPFILALLAQTEGLRDKNATQFLVAGDPSVFNE